MEDCIPLLLLLGSKADFFSLPWKFTSVVVLLALPFIPQDTHQLPWASLINFAPMEVNLHRHVEETYNSHGSCSNNFQVVVLSSIVFLLSWAWKHLQFHGFWDQGES